MVPPAKYTIGNYGFRIKADIVVFIRGIVDRYTPGETLDARDFEFIIALLERHPHAIEKMGIGIAFVRVVLSHYGKKHFELVRTDGGTTDFSWRHCVYPHTTFADFSAACRNTIRADIALFKHNYFSTYARDGSIVCPVTGELAGFGDLEVDHKPPLTFAVLRDKWVEDNGLRPDQISLTGFGDGEQVKCFASARIAHSFREYHNKHATLRLLTRAGNLITELNRRAIADALAEYVEMEIYAILQCNGIPSGSRTAEDYELAKRIVFQGVRVKESIFNRILCWIDKWIFEGTKLVTDVVADAQEE